MGDWALSPGGYAGVNGTVTTGSSYGVRATTSASANTKGSWVELVAAAAAAPATQAFVLTFSVNAAYAWDWLLDIAIGGAGSEVVIVENLLFSQPIAGWCEAITLPIAIPAATRVAVRAQCGYANASNLDVAITLLTGGSGMPSSCAGYTGIGANTATSGGVNITPGSNTKGSYAEVIASTARAYKGLLVRGGTKSTVFSQQISLTDIAVGGAGSEVIVIPNLQTVGSAGRSSTPFIPISVPAGIRLAARAAGSSTAQFYLSIGGVY
jgi:hypothetical protein